MAAIPSPPPSTPSPPPLEERSQEAAAFLRWVLSPEGQTLVEQTGYTAIQP